MKLFYYPLQNFGDAPLNRWLWPRLLPSQLDADDQTLLVGIGSLLNDRLPQRPVKAVLGSGFGYSHGPVKPDARWRVYCVRGPVTARRLGLPPEMAVTDGGMFLGTLSLPSRPKTHRVSYMPHWRSEYHGNWRHICGQANIQFIDPAGDVTTILDSIQSTELLLTEALHGAVAADALRVPWVSIRAYRHILALKWEDWSASIGLGYRPVRLLPLYHSSRVADALQARLSLPAPAWLMAGLRLASQALYQVLVTPTVRALQRLAREAAPQLSADPVFDRVTTRLQDALERLKSDFRDGYLSAPYGASTL